MKTIREITISAMFLAVLLGQEYALMFLPNVSLTVVLLMIYAAVLPWKMLVPLTLAYVFLDNLLMGSLNVLYFVPMLGIWLILVSITKIIRDRPFWVLLVWGTLFGFFYGWGFAIPQVLLTGVDVWVYLAADIPFDVILCINNFITISLLYPVVVPLLKNRLTSGLPSSEI